jgi:hypothetical protein
MNIYGLHWIPTHRGNLGGMSDRDIFARWQPGMVKIVTVDNRVPYLEDVPPNSKIVVRNHPMSELNDSRGTLRALDMTPADYWQSVTKGQTCVGPDGLQHPERWTSLDSIIEHDMLDGWTEAVTMTAEQIGAQHAATCRQMADYCAAQGVGPERLVFEGLNEPQVWTAGEAPEAVARYYRAFIMGLHDYGLHGVVGNFGVGWPGNGGVQDAPVDWKFFEPVVNAMRAGDYLGLHEYWALDGPQQNWRWWAGRFLQCPFDVPILITECGIDTGVTGHWYGGWRDLAGHDEKIKAMRYVYELQHYAEECAHDGRIKQVFPFTYDIGSSHWEKFDIRNWNFLDAFFAVQDTWPQVPGVLQPPPVGNFKSWLWDEAADEQVIQFNPAAALQKAIFADGFVPNSPEFERTWQGATIVVQRAERLSDGVVRVYYVRRDNWDDVAHEQYEASGQWAATHPA